MRTISKSLLLVFFGILYAAGFPILGSKISFIFGPILGFAGLFYLNQLSTTLPSLILNALFFSLGFYLFGFYWIPHTLTEFGGIIFPFNFLIGLFSIFVICPHIFIFQISSYLLKKQNPFNNLPNSIQNIVWSVLFLFFQYAIPQLFNAYPGHAWIKIAPRLSLAPIFGEYLFSFLSILISFELLELYQNKKFNFLNWIFCIFIILLNLILPLKISDDTLPLKIRIAQANIGNNAKLSAEKGLPNSVDLVLDTYSKLSNLSDGFLPDLIIWPETAYPFTLHPNIINKSISVLPEVFQEIINKNNSSLFFGGYLQDIKGTYGRSFNSAFLIGKNLSTKVYNKNKLLPFGESLPFPEGINKAIHSIIPSISFFSQSNDTTLFSAKTNDEKQYSFLGSICYEILSTGLIRSQLNSFDTHPNFLINLTNDSWYGKTSEPEQHLFLSKWRSIEFALPLIRSANTGISTIIDARGIELSRTTIDSVTKLDLEMNYLKKPQKTIYQKWGILPIILLIIILIVCNLFYFRKSFSK